MSSPSVGACTYADDTCRCISIYREPDFSIRSEPSSDLQRRQGAFSTDGTCGPQHGNTICDPKSTVYTGGCCSVGI